MSEKLLDGQSDQDSMQYAKIAREMMNEEKETSFL